MSSDEMRVELESFVNKGLKQGWRGWPLKSQFSCWGGLRNVYRADTNDIIFCSAKDIRFTVSRSKYH